MASDQRHDSDGARTGFAGLSHLVSNVGDPPSPSAPPRPETSDSPSPAKQGPPSPATPPRLDPPGCGTASDHGAPAPGGSAARIWGVIIAVVVAFVWSLSHLVDSGPPSPPPKSVPGTGSGRVAPAPPPSTQRPTTKQPPAPPVSPSPDAHRPAPNSPAPAIPQARELYSDDKPPEGSGRVLWTPQIRYCLAEEARIAAAEPLVDGGGQGDIDRFNAMVRDYNSRCSSFRYQRSNFEEARRDVERARGQLQAEGQSRFRQAPSAQARPSSPRGTSPRSPEAVLTSIQERLNALGYGAGRPDGRMGPRTRAAIQAFQRDKGLTPDGVPSAELLTIMNAAGQRP